jgi:hypothetical protein
MSSWEPRSLVDGTLINVAQHFEGADPLLPAITGEKAWKSSLADRMIHGPTASSLEALLRDSPLRHADPVSFEEALTSHAISPESLGDLERGDREQFLLARERTLRTRLSASAALAAEWGSSDRPPIGSLVIADGDDGDD